MTQILGDEALGNGALGNGALGNGALGNQALENQPPGVSGLRASIIAELGVRPSIHAASEVRRRVDFLKAYLLSTPARGFVLGISGGQDSSLTGRLCALAVSELGAERGQGYTLVATRLPYHVQADEADAQLALSFIRAPAVVTLDIGPATDAAARSVQEALGQPLSQRKKLCPLL